jgi:hypothetical protein
MTLSGDLPIGEPEPPKNKLTLQALKARFLKK